MSLDDLLAACRANPDDDAPRLVWADAVGEERGELVVLQCRLARDDLPPAERAELRRTCDELLEEFGREWSGFGYDRRVAGCVFRRGFVDAVELDLAAMPLATVFDKAPLVASVRGSSLRAYIDYRNGEERRGVDALAVLGALFETAAVQQLRGLEIHDTSVTELIGDSEWDYESRSLADEVLELAAASRGLDGLHALAITEAVTSRGVNALGASRFLPQLEMLKLGHGDLHPDQALVLFAKMPKLRALDLHNMSDLAALAPTIPTSVVELWMEAPPARALEALAASPVARSLQRLHIGTETFSGIGDAKVLAAFPQLRALSLPRALGRRATELAQVALPALRELHTYAHVTSAGFLALAEAFGPQLERFDAIGAEQPLDDLDAIAGLVAGDFVIGPYEDLKPVLQVGVNTREPWVRYGVVPLGQA